MKKIAFLLTVIIALFTVGCNEKNLVKNIEGNWHVSKYTVDGKDQTRWFDTTYTGFTWQFTGDKKYSKTWAEKHISNVYTSDTISHYDSTAMVVVIDSINTTSAIVPFVYYAYVPGDWVLTNGNKYVIARDSLKNTLYQIVDHSPKALHLYSGSEDYYLAQ